MPNKGKGTRTKKGTTTSGTSKTRPGSGRSPKTKR